MSDLIETLNHTSGPRTLWYCCVFLIALAIIADGLSSVVASVFKKKP